MTGGSLLEFTNEDKQNFRTWLRDATTADIKLALSNNPERFRALIENYEDELFFRKKGE